MLPPSLPDVVSRSPDAPLPAAPTLEKPEPGGEPVEPDEPKLEDPGLEEPDEPDEPDELEEPDDPAEPAEPDEPVPPPAEAPPAPPDDSPAPSPGILIGRNESFAAI